MYSRLPTIGLSLILLGAAACQSPQSAETDMVEASMENGDVEMAEPMKVIGSLVYHQRIALPPEADASIFIYEQGPADAVREPIATAEFDLNGRQVPIPFEVEIPDELELATDRLSLRAQIHDGEGELIWTSDTANIFERAPGDYDIGVVQLVPTRAAVISMEELTSHEWMVARIDDAPLYQDSKITLNFGEDGRISGTASCNSYTGSFKLQNGRLTTGPMALTRRACMVPLMDQEMSFVKLIEDNPTVELDDDGVLTIVTEGGRVLIAR